MTELENLKLSDIMPPNLLRDPFVKAMCDALDVQLNKLVENNKKISIYANIDNLPEEIINYLAWQLHVDFYDENWNIKQKRDAVKNSIKWHRYKGTIGALEDYITTLFGEAKIQEWWEYSGGPYHFRINMNVENIVDIDTLKRITKAIYSIKNTRSWIDYLNFVSKRKNNYYVTGVPSIYEVIKITEHEYTPQNIKGKNYIGGYTKIFESTNINVIPDNVLLDANKKIYIGGYTKIFESKTIKGE